jgi:hypothetical protein
MMMKHGIAWALRGTVCALALGALSVARAGDAEVKLARTYKANDPIQYKSVYKISVGGMDVVRTTVVKDTVKEIKPTGDVVLATETISDQVEIGGAPMDIMDDPITTTYDKTGKITEFKGVNAGGAIGPEVLNLIAVAHNVLLTDKPVKKDDKWETEVDNPVIKGKKITLKETFLGTEKRDGKDLWKVKQTVEAPTDDAGGKLVSEYTALLDPATGQLVHSEGSMKDVPSQYGQLTWTEETNQQKPDDTKKAAAK